MNLTWKDRRGPYSNGEDLFANDIAVGSYFYGAFLRGDEKPYKIATALPSLQPKVKEFKTPEEAKEALQAFTNRWFNRALSEEHARKE